MTRWKFLSGCLSPSLSHLYWVISEAFSWAPLFPDSHSSFFLFPVPSPPPHRSFVFSPCLPISALVFLWHQCKASIIKRCMGVCVSGREGLGTPPAPPAEEALTAEHWGLIPSTTTPSSSAHPHFSLTSLLLSHLFPSLAFSPNLPLFPIVVCTLTQFPPTCYVP